jgi:hypothetical protein
MFTCTVGERGGDVGLGTRRLESKKKKSVCGEEGDTCDRARDVIYA